MAICIELACRHTPGRRERWQEESRHRQEDSRPDLPAGTRPAPDRVWPTRHTAAEDPPARSVAAPAAAGAGPMAADAGAIAAAGAGLQRCQHLRRRRCPDRCRPSRRRSACSLPTSGHRAVPIAQQVPHHGRRPPPLPCPYHLNHRITPSTLGNVSQAESKEVAAGAQGSGSGRISYSKNSPRITKGSCREIGRAHV